MLPQYTFGFDFGNAETCAVVIGPDSIRRPLVLPSATAAGSLSHLALTRSATDNAFLRDADALDHGEHVLRLGSSEVFVGKLAVEQARSASTGLGDISRYWSDRALHLLLTSSGLLIDSPDYELHIVTGLPIETFTKENRQRVKDALEGEHRFTLNGRNRRATVTVSRVVMEGAGALISFGENQDVLQGVVDIGGRTTDLYAAQGQKAIVELCKGKPLGVEGVSDILNTRFQSEYKRTLKPGETRNTLRSYLGVEDAKIIQANGIRVAQDDLHQWTHDAIEQVASDILGFVSTVWRSSEHGSVASDIAPVILVGGGAYYFGSYLKRRIPHAHIPQRPEIANAEGYAKLAHGIYLRDRHAASRIA